MNKVYFLLKACQQMKIETSMCFKKKVSLYLKKFFRSGKPLNWQQKYIVLLCR